MDIDIPQENIKYLSQQAKVELTTTAKEYVSNLLAEASRLEAANREHNGQPEITRVNIKDADLLLRKYPHKSNKSWGFTIIQVIASITTLLTGVLVPDTPEKLQNYAGLTFFVIVLSCALIFATIQIILGRTQ